MAGVAMIGSSAIGAASQAYGASKASGAQTKMGIEAIKLAEQKYQESKGRYYDIRNDLNPYTDAGDNAASWLQNKTADFVAPIVIDQATLNNTPGYQFTQTQGQKAVQNAAAARGLGVSGAALKGAAEFATQTANKTYQDQFNLENINRTNAYNRLIGTANIGLTANQASIGAANALTGAGTSTGATQAGSATGIGNAQAAGYNAMGQAVSNFAGNVGGFSMTDKGQNFWKGIYDKAA